MNKRKLPNNTVFQYFRVVFFAVLMGYPCVHFAQLDRSDQWKKSVRSLTIFQPGDAVRIAVWDLQSLQKQYLDFSRDYPINPEGYIIMPIIGEVKVKGLTLYELSQTLEERFRDHLAAPLVYVRPLIRITLQGAFNKPGAYHADPSSSLWDVVALANGPGPGCNLPRMRVERGGKIAIRSVLKDFEEGVSLEEVGIESGDQIIAPRRGTINIHFLLALVNFFTSLALLYIRLRSGTL